MKRSSKDPKVDADKARGKIVIENATALFQGDQEAALNWLNTPAKALGGETPLSKMQTEAGVREIEDLIGRLEHGVFS